MRTPPRLALVCAAVALAGCGSDPSGAVRAKVEQFASAVSHRDYTTICDQVLASSLIARLTAAGVTCEQGMQIALGPVQNPQLSIGKVSVKGKQASVIALTLATGQSASIDAIELTDTSQGWRIVSLGSPGHFAGG